MVDAQTVGTDISAVPTPVVVVPIVALGLYAASFARGAPAVLTETATASPFRSALGVAGKGSSRRARKETRSSEKGPMAWKLSCDALVTRDGTKFRPIP
jgi:hypothetical protein